ncbi:MAG TPA: FHA domain-containing protein [Candidatus Thermoplasmatota archaeon]|nr:FHA domain-containing protein [Candidatus Thermoplasmatota archaeon]
MADRSGGPVDYEGLADFLHALAYPTRLELLDILRFPHALGEIKLSPRRAAPGVPDERTASRQAIHGHLEKLVDADLVRVEPAPEGSRSQQRYVVNPPKLYALVEELRRLAVMQVGGGAAGDATGTLMEPARPQAAKGARLVLVHGAYEGKVFPLDAKTAVDGVWTIGRRRALPVCLDYDPYVSLENAVMAQRGGQFAVTDLPGSKNGTMVNWSRLAKGGTRPLKAGDIISLGRSRLCFVPE